jgi:glycosyltransferase involved in cell wall biosynthesis
MEKRVRVCYVSLLFWPEVGGIEVQVEKQARRLIALGHEVIILTTRLEKHWPRTETLNGLPVVRIGGIYTRAGSLRIGRLGIWAVNVTLLLALWRLRNRYDVIHVFQLSPLAAASTFASKLLGKPIVVMIQSAGPTETQRARLEQDSTLMADLLTDTSFLRVERQDWITSGDLNYLPHATLGGWALLRFLRRSDAIYQVLSTRCGSALVEQGFRPERIIRIPGSVDTDRFRPASDTRPDPTRPERDIICVARLAFPKGVDVLLHAWGRMMHAAPAWRASVRPRLLLVGDGADRAQLERIARELGIEDSIAFMGMRSDTVTLLQRSWGFVLPSRWEGMPNALLEAMACGLPCIATRVSGSEDIIVDGVNGLLVEPEDPVALAEALRRLIEDSDLAERLALEARSTTLRHYQLEQVVQRCLDLYRSVRKTRQYAALPVASGGHSSE